MSMLLRIVIIIGAILAYSGLGLLMLALFARLAHEDFRKEAHHMSLLFTFVLGWPLILVVLVIIAPAMCILTAADAWEARSGKQAASDKAEESNGGD